METTKKTPKPNFLQRSVAAISDIFKSLSERLELLGEVALVNLYTLILLIIIYLFYWTFPQAKDLLLTINQESHFQITLFFTSLITLAGICWYMPRYFYEENKKTCKEAMTWKELFTVDMKGHRTDYEDGTGYEDENVPPQDEADLREKYFKEMIPRVLSTALLFLVTLGILNVGNEMNSAESTEFPWNISAYLVLAILGTTLLVILLLGSRATLFGFNRWLNERLGNKILIYFGFVALVLLGLMWTKKGGVDDLPYLLFASFLVSLSFLVFTVCRQQIPFFRQESNLRYPLGILVLFFSLGFILINVVPTLSQKMNPLICANFAFIFYLTILYAIRFWGMRRGIRSVLFLIAGIFVIASVTSSFRHHEISYLNNRYDPGKRLTTEAYFKNWIDQRKGAIDSYLSTHPNGSFPVVIVSAEGGGSRAAFWTSRIHGYLEEQIPNYYQDHLFALTGASGGSTGNCAFFAMKQGEVATEDMKKMSSDMFLENYLSSSLTLLMGADFIQDILGLPISRNRAKQLEKEWGDKMGSLLGSGKINAFKQPFLDFWYDDNTHLKPNVQPLLFINTTQVQGAGHAIVSPVQLEQKTYRGMDLLDTLYQIDPSKTIPLITANLLNASFPYINPAGQINGVGSFVDAGYFDNYGARTGAGLLKELSAIRANGDSTYQKIKFIAVLIRNSTADRDTSQSASDKKAIPSNQLLAPVSTISNIRSAINDHNFWDLQKSADDFFLIDLKRVPIELQPGAKPVLPVIPLARYLSPLAIQAMETALDSLGNNKNSNLTGLVRALE